MIKRNKVGGVNPYCKFQVECVKWAELTDLLLHQIVSKYTEINGISLSTCFPVELETFQ